MPDYDVGVVGLAAPPASAPVATYYPAVSVKNYGIHPATVTGTLRIYDKAVGSLLATHALASTAPIEPGATENVPSPTTWIATEADVNRQFLFIADVTTPGDQNDLNNHLGPLTVTVTAAAPPPLPPTVPHATQHMSGAADELNVGGLKGKLDTHQDPTSHAASHQKDGSDQLSVDGLVGILADPQPVTNHGNEAHAPNFATASALSAHTGAATPHDGATNLEKTVNKGAPNGYTPLDATGHVPPGNLPPGFGGDAIVLHDAIEIPPGVETEVLGLDVPLGEMGPASHFRVFLYGSFNNPSPSTPATLYIRAGSDTLSPSLVYSKTLLAPSSGLVKLTSEHLVADIPGIGIRECSIPFLCGSFVSPGFLDLDINPVVHEVIWDPQEEHRLNIRIELDGSPPALFTALGAAIQVLHLEHA